MLAYVIYFLYLCALFVENYENSTNRIRKDGAYDRRYCPE